MLGGGQFTASAVYGGAGPSLQPSATGVPEHASAGLPEPMARTEGGPHDRTGTAKGVAGRAQKIAGDPAFVLVALLALAALLVGVSFRGAIEVGS
jgi:hypothetical protein